jgi:tetratricopeptide (TPR) repeat protein
MFPEFEVVLKVFTRGRTFEVGPLRRAHARSMVDVMQTIDEQAFVYVYHSQAKSPSGETDAVAAGVLGFHAGNALWKRGELEAARVAYRTAMVSGYSEAVGKAAYNLAILELDQGNEEAAVTTFRTAIAADNLEAATAASYELGVLREKRGDTAAARVAFLAALTGNVQEVLPAAACWLAGLVKDLDLSWAKSLYRLAIDFGDPEVTPIAAFNLGNLEFDTHPAAAVDLYRIAAASGHPSAALEAGLRLGYLLEQAGDVDGTRATYETLVPSETWPTHPLLQCANKRIVFYALESVGYRYI